MPNTRGVFTLEKIKEKDILEEWVGENDVWIGLPASNNGYFAGGLASGPILFSTMDKVSYSSDTTTAVPGASLSAARSYLAATSSSSSGYFAGGLSPSIVSTIDRVNYSTDTTSVASNASLDTSRYRFGATGNLNFGYLSGGTLPGGTASSTTKINYSSNTSALVPGAPLSAARYLLSATGNSTDGYFGGGAVPGQVSIMDKLTYASDTVAAVPGAALSIARWGLSATGNSTAGYFGGGVHPTNLSTMDKVTYSSDTTSAVPGANLSLARYYLASTGNSTNGYFGGGGAPSAVTTMDKINYSLDTTAAVPGANLSAARYSLASTSARSNSLPAFDLSRSIRFFDGLVSPPNNGYFGGGVRSTMQKVSYSSDTVVTVPSTALASARYNLSAISSSVAGYFGGGRIPGFVPSYSTMEKVTYSTDTTVGVPGAFLTLTRRDQASVGDLNSGYFVGGQRSTTDKLTYSTDTTVLVPGLSFGGFMTKKQGSSATTTFTSGYVAVGEESSASTYTKTSSVNKITYSNETLSNISNGAIIGPPRGFMAASGNLTDGYFAGGNTVVAVSVVGDSTIQKISYSSDTMQSSRSNLPSNRYSLAATGNLSDGYFAGGILFNGSTRSFSSIDKISYATDTILTTNSGATLSTGFSSFAGTTGLNGLVSEPTSRNIYDVAYFAGGFNLATVQKFNFSTESIGENPSAGRLSSSRYAAASTSSLSAAYFGGGSPISILTAFNKINYFTDTRVAVPGLELSFARNYLAASGNSNSGYFAGGNIASLNFVSTVDKVTYSTEIDAQIPSAALTTVRSHLAATGNITSGYFAGGIVSATTPLTLSSTLDKINYSTDTTTVLPSTSLNAARYFFSGTGNSTVGYFAGGRDRFASSMSTTEKLDYSSETQQLLPSSSSLVSNLYGHSATGNHDFGYFAGGYVATTTTFMQRISYSSDTLLRLVNNIPARSGSTATNLSANGVGKIV